jgi:surface polysaccharide O-acyltransferase-like enzyme
MSSRPFFGHVHAFRAFAIVNIAAVHAVALWLWALGPQARSTPALELIGRVNEVLLHDSTIYFALISGLLYSLVLHGRGVASFYRGKAANVLLPYVVLSVLFSLLDWTPQRGWFVGLPEGTKLPDLILQNLFTGQALFVYWYIPVVLALFVLTPPMYRLLAGPRGLGWLALCLALPGVFSRTGIELSLSSVLYFLAPYALGMWLGQDYEARLAWVRRAWRPLLAIVVASAPALYWSVEIDRGAPQAFFDGVETLFYLQKTALALLVLLALRRFDAGVPRGMARLADAAFAIYFLHSALLFELIPWLMKLVAPSAAWPVQLAIMALLLVLCVAGSLLITRGLQALFGRRSRYLVGA